MQMDAKSERELAIQQAIEIAENYANHPGIDDVGKGIKLAGAGMVWRLRALLGLDPEPAALPAEDSGHLGGLQNTGPRR